MYVSTFDIIIIMLHHHTAHVDAAYCYRLVAWSVGLSLTVVSCAKTAEPTEMPFGLWAWMGPQNHILDGGSDSPWEEAMLRGKTGGQL